MENPFRTGGVIRPPYFADREAEIRRFRKALGQAGGKLIVSGERRMGKTSTLSVALDEHREAGGLGILADFSTASTVADLANRILAAATRELSRRWQDRLLGFFRRLQPEVRLGSDVLGQPTASFSLGLRETDVEVQYQSLAGVLDALESLARERQEVFAIVLDEFQELHSLGGEQAEWRLRGVVQHHQQLSYVFSGSKPSLIRRMQQKNRAFYQLADRFAFGPIAPSYLASWIDTRMQESGVRPTAAGELIVRLAGPRTRDVVQLARKTFDLARGSGMAEESLVRAAFRELIGEEDDTVRLYWDGLSPAQQNVLRAIAAGEARLMSQSTQHQFALSSPAAVRKAIRKFMEDGIVIQQDARGGYACDSPFVRGWLIEHALVDIGLFWDPTELSPQ